MKFLRCSTIWQVIWKPIVLFFVLILFSAIAYKAFGVDTTGIGDVWLVITGTAFVYGLATYIHHLIKNRNK